MMTNFFIVLITILSIDTRPRPSAAGIKLPGFTRQRNATYSLETLTTSFTQILDTHTRRTRTRATTDQGTAEQRNSL